jgi:hypothetical protein
VGIVRLCLIVVFAGLVGGGVVGLVLGYGCFVRRSVVGELSQCWVVESYMC